MTPLEQIQTLQKLVLEYQEHNLKLIEENAQLRAKVEVPRDMQQEANLLARENNEEWVKREMAELKERAAFLEGELSEARLNLLSLEGQCVEGHHWKGNCPAEALEDKIAEAYADEAAAVALVRRARAELHCFHSNDEKHLHEMELGEFAYGHWCPRCDESVDRNGEIRLAMDTLLAKYPAP